MTFFFVSWFLITLIILYYSTNLLVLLILLEMMSFCLISFFSFYSFTLVLADYYIMILFTVFVMEGVIALSGLISLVSFTGSDYVLSNSALKT